MATQAATETTTSTNQNPSAQASGKSAERKATAAVGGKPKRERKLATITNDLPPVWKGEAEGDFIEGIYLGTRRLKVRRNSFLTHLIQNEETGEVKSCSGAIMDRLLCRVPIDNVFVRITFTGWVNTQSGKAREFDVQYEEGIELLPETSPDQP